jgi:hypothetical protein
MVLVSETHSAMNLGAESFWDPFCHELFLQKVLGTHSTWSLWVQKVSGDHSAMNLWAEFEICHELQKVLDHSAMNSKGNEFQVHSAMNSGAESFRDPFCHELFVQRF